MVVVIVPYGEAQLKATKINLPKYAVVDFHICNYSNQIPSAAILESVDMIVLSTCFRSGRSISNYFRTIQEQNSFRILKIKPFIFWFIRNLTHKSYSDYCLRTDIVIHVLQHSGYAK